jgi:acyl-CoA thioesterase
MSDQDNPSSVPEFPLAEFCAMTVVPTGEGLATGRVDVDLSKHANPNDVLHGAVLFTLADTTMGAAVVSTLGEGEICASIEVHMRFLKPVTGGSVHAATHVVQRGRRIVQLAAEMRDDADRMVATATGSFAIIAPG